MPLRGKPHSVFAARSSFGHHARSRSECRLRSPLTGGARHQQPPLCPMRKMTTSAADIGLCSRSGETPELFISNNQDVAPHRFGGTHQGRQPRIVAPALGPSHLRLEVTGTVLPVPGSCPIWPSQNRPSLVYWVLRTRRRREKPAPPAERCGVPQKPTSDQGRPFVCDVPHELPDEW